MVSSDLAGVEIDTEDFNCEYVVRYLGRDG